MQDLRNPLLVTGMLLYVFIPGSFMGISMANVFFFHDVLGMSAVKIGLLMLPFSIGALISLRLVGQFFNRFGARPLLITGMTSFFLAIAMLCQVHSGDQFTYLLVIYFMFGVGSSLVSGAAQTMAMSHISNQKMAKVSALWNLNRQMAFSLGVAFFTMILQIVLALGGVTLEASSQKEIIIHAFHHLYLVSLVVTLLPLWLVTKINMNIYGV